MYWFWSGESELNIGLFPGQIAGQRDWRGATAESIHQTKSQCMQFVCI